MAEAQNRPLILGQLPSSPHALHSDRALATLASPASQMSSAEDQRTRPDAAPEPQSESDLDTQMPDAPVPQPESEVVREDQPESESETSQPSPMMENTNHPPPQPDDPSESRTDEPRSPEQASEPNPVPEWVTWEEDTSVPTEEELNEFEGTEANPSASDVAAYEKKMFREWPDPEQRPVKKIRLSWVIKGVRGTREKPNMARAMHSPAAFVDGLYWQIKFYPRGNKTDSLCAYIRCSLDRPVPDTDLPESTFAYFEGPPDANVGEGAEPKEVVKTDRSPAKKEDKPDGESQSAEGADKTMDSDGVAEQSLPATSQGPQEAHTAESVSDSQTEAEADPARNHHPEAKKTDKSSTSGDEERDFRVATQLGMVIYNPQEARTAVYMSSEHQFNPYTDDWGWTSFSCPWREAHKRKRGQFQALLRNDTLAIDAYIMIFDDPTQALWWHESPDHEAIWPSKRLAGYHPIGTPPLYHSPAVAGFASWFLLAPFRRVLQSVDAGKWRQNSQVRPRPLVAMLQKALHRMRHLTSDSYVDVYKSIQALNDLGEDYHDVLSFWEVLRRSVELELAEDNEALAALSDIFDVMGTTVKVPPLPVKGVGDIQQALQRVTIPSPMIEHGPRFLPLVLKRDTFDQAKREWRLLHDRVALNEEIEMPGSRERYTLYGFAVHVGERSSGCFYSILRPNGPGGKWLAFEDGDGNQVSSYTRHKLKEFEGLEGEALANARGTRTTAYLAMYVKTSCLTEFLPGVLEDYEAPAWIAPPNASEEKLADEERAKEKEAMIDVEVYHDDSIVGRTGPIDMFNMKSQAHGEQTVKTYTFPRSMTFNAMRRKLAEDLGLDNPQKLRGFIMKYGSLGQYNHPRLENLRLNYTIDDRLTDSRLLCIWCSTLKTEADVDLFGYPDKNIKEPRTEARSNQDGENFTQAEVQASVEHGHSTDVVMSEDDDGLGTSAAPSEPLLAATNERETQQVATAVSSQADAQDEQQQYPRVSPDPADDSMANTDATPAQAPVTPETDGSGAGNRLVSRTRPVCNVYGILQLFEADRQNFVVHRTFFAKREEPVKDAIRRCLGYDAERAFLAWYQASDRSGRVVGDGVSFSDLDFVDGDAIVAGEVLGEERLAELRGQGKFSDPLALSLHMRLCERRHPIQSLTSAEPVEISDFGGEYFRGPLVNGQPHGPNCTKITAHGHTYTGPMVMSQKSGDSGKMVYQNGDVYEGGWLRDERHGQGTLVQRRTGNTYVGGFMNGKRWGKGTTHWEMADEEASMCQICYGADIDALFYSCGHVCACSECAKQCSVCPICRKDIREVVRMFWA